MISEIRALFTQYWSWKYPFSSIKWMWQEVMLYRAAKKEGE